MITEERTVKRYSGPSKYTTVHANGLVTHGATEPIMTVLDVRGFEIRDMFLIGMNRQCGSIIFPTQGRALEAKAALEPAYAVRVEPFEHTGDWAAIYDQREMDGTVPSWFIRDIALKDGTVVMRDGRWLH